MTSLFFRLYLAVSIAVLLSSITTGWFFWIKWQPDSNAQLTRLVTPALKEIAKELRNEQIDQPNPFPKEWIDRLQIPHLTPPKGWRFKELKRFAAETTWLFAVLPLDLLGLNQDEHRKLINGEVIYRNNAKGRLAYIALNEQEILEATLFSSNTPLKQVLSGFHFIAQRHGSYVSPLKGIEAKLLEGEEIIVTPLKDSGLSHRKIIRLLYGPRTYARLIGTSHLVQALAFTEEGEAQLLELNLELSLPIFPPVILIPLAVLLIGIALWLSLSPLKRKLSKLAEVTERFGKGDLNARVNLKGRGPLESISNRFDRSADRIKDLIQSHESLLQAVSHELRTPISRLYFYNDLLVDEEQYEQRVSLGQDVHQTLEELRSLTTELLDFNRLSSGSIELIREICDLSLLTQNAYTLSRPHRKQIELAPVIEGITLGLELTTLGEDRLLNRAILNLLKNADQYATQCVRVSLGCGVISDLDPDQHEDHDQNWIWVHVDDDGPGIPYEDRARILEPFVRLEESRSRAQGGTGLGLSIVQSIIKAHQGYLKIEESPLGGARFSIYLRFHLHKDSNPESIEVVL